jgi:hypothetical protein
MYHAGLLFLLTGMFQASPTTCKAANAFIDSFNVTREQNNPPMGTFYNKMAWQYDMTWNGTPRQGSKMIWWVPNVGSVLTIVSTLHNTSPGDNVTGTQNDAPRNGGKYTMRIRVINPDTGEIFAQHTKEAPM